MVWDYPFLGLIPRVFWTVFLALGAFLLVSLVLFVFATTSLSVLEKVFLMAIALIFTYSFLLMLLSALRLPYKARVLDTGCIRFSSLLAQVDISPREVQQIVRLLRTRDWAAYQDAPAWTRTDHLSLPEHQGRWHFDGVRIEHRDRPFATFSPPSSTVHFLGVVIDRGGSSLTIPGRTALALAARIVSDNGEDRLQPDLRCFECVLSARTGWPWSSFEVSKLIVKNGVA